MEILTAVPDDTGEIYRIMTQAGSDIKDRSWYLTDTEDYVRQHIGNRDKGIVFKAVEDGQIAAFFLIHLPGPEADNLGYYKKLDDSECLKVAYMDSMAVAPGFRGRGLQYAMMDRGGQYLTATPYCHLMGTVHPDNIYSLGNFLKLGFEVVTTVRKYGGLPRHIMYKRI